jgi:hypothetical protein
LAVGSNGEKWNDAGIWEKMQELWQRCGLWQRDAVTLHWELT